MPEKLSLNIRIRYFFVTHSATRDLHILMKILLVFLTLQIYSIKSNYSVYGLNIFYKKSYLLFLLYKFSLSKFFMHEIVLFSFIKYFMQQSIFAFSYHYSTKYSTSHSLYLLLIMAVLFSLFLSSLLCSSSFLYSLITTLNSQQQ